ncbi:MAG: hypothetical protein QW350_05385 [Candidatus Aenigmatarchaeota archaeon]
MNVVNINPKKWKNFTTIGILLVFFGLILIAIIVGINFLNIKQIFNAALNTFFVVLIIGSIVGGISLSILGVLYRRKMKKEINETRIREFLKNLYIRVNVLEVEILMRSIVILNVSALIYKYLTDFTEKTSIESKFNTSKEFLREKVEIVETDIKNWFENKSKQLEKIERFSKIKEDEKEKGEDEKEKLINKFFNRTWWVCKIISDNFRRLKNINDYEELWTDLRTIRVDKQEVGIKNEFLDLIGKDEIERFFLGLKWYRESENDREKINRFLEVIKELDGRDVLEELEQLSKEIRNEEIKNITKEILEKLKEAIERFNKDGKEGKKAFENAVKDLKDRLKKIENDIRKLLDDSFSFEVKTELMSDVLNVMENVTNEKEIRDIEEKLNKIPFIFSVSIVNYFNSKIISNFEILFSEREKKFSHRRREPHKELKIFLESLKKENEIEGVEGNVKNLHIDDEKKTAEEIVRWIKIAEINILNKIKNESVVESTYGGAINKSNDVIKNIEEEINNINRKIIEEGERYSIIVEEIRVKYLDDILSKSKEIFHRFDELHEKLGTSIKSDLNKELDSIKSYLEKNVTNKKLKDAFGVVLEKYKEIINFSPEKKEKEEGESSEERQSIVGERSKEGGERTFSIESGRESESEESEEGEHEEINEEGEGEISVGGEEKREEVGESRNGRGRGEERTTIGTGTRGIGRGRRGRETTIKRGGKRRRPFSRGWQGTKSRVYKPKEQK